MPKKALSKRGYQFSLDGYGGKEKLLNDLDYIYEFLEHCPDLVQLNKIIPPWTFKYHGKDPANSGRSGFVLTEPGVHVSVHTFPKRGYLNLDIFSTEERNFEPALAYTKQLFGLKRVKTSISERDRIFPSKLATAVRSKYKEREAVIKTLEEDPPDDCT